MINFHIPDFSGNWRMNLYIIDLLAKHPEYFYDGVRIASSYGCFPPSLWNGGRTAVGTIEPPMVPFLIKEYNKRGVPVRFTYTNPCVTKEHLSDKFCNYVTKMAENGLNEIIVNVPVLEEYIRKTYPKYPLISSTVKQIENLSQLKAELEKDYKLVVLDYNWNNRFDVLEELPHKDKIELLVNAYCTPACKRRKDHYKFLGNLQIAKSYEAFEPAKIKNKNFLNKEFPCPNMNMCFMDTIDYSTHISAKDIYEKYVPMGYSNFKIEGRLMNAVYILESYMYYLIKPECRDKVRNHTLKDLLVPKAEKRLHG